MKLNLKGVVAQTGAITKSVAAGAVKGLDKVLIDPVEDVMAKRAIAKTLTDDEREFAKEMAKEARENLHVMAKRAKAEEKARKDAERAAKDATEFLEAYENAPEVFAKAMEAKTEEVQTADA